MNKNVIIPNKKKVKVDNRRLQAYLIKQTQPNLTFVQLSELMGVSISSVKAWVKDIKDNYIDESSLVEAAKKRLTAMVVPAANVYNRAIAQGQDRADYISLQAAKDILKNKGILKDKIEVEHTIKDKDDKDLTDELKKILGGMVGVGGCICMYIGLI